MDDLISDIVVILRDQFPEASDHRIWVIAKQCAIAAKAHYTRDSDHE
jgi:hypothetical protein